MTLIELTCDFVGPRIVRSMQAGALGVLAFCGVAPPPLLGRVGLASGCNIDPLLITPILPHT
jgi:hypothetical protein